MWARAGAHARAAPLIAPTLQRQPMNTIALPYGLQDVANSLLRGCDEYSRVHDPGRRRVLRRRTPRIAHRPRRRSRPRPPAHPLFQSRHPLRHRSLPGFRDCHFLRRRCRLRERGILQHPYRHVPRDCHYPRRSGGSLPGCLHFNQSSRHNLRPHAPLFRIPFPQAANPRSTQPADPIPGPRACS